MSFAPRVFLLNVPTFMCPLNQLRIIMHGRMSGNFEKYYEGIRLRVALSGLETCLYCRT